MHDTYVAGAETAEIMAIYSEERVIRIQYVAEQRRINMAFERNWKLVHGVFATNFDALDH
jgi:hypothetical protein